MAQIFRPSSNSIAKLSIIASGLLLGGLLFFLGALERSPYNTRQKEFVEQPVPFSHQHHVADVGLDCRYCHFNVEKTATAGVPPTSVCMNCHSQIFADAPMLKPVRDSFKTGESIEWNRVHDLPDFVYFNHSIHVAKGVGCTTCHGKVDQMPLMYQNSTLQMSWCLECHRNPENFIRPKEDVFRVDYVPPSDQIHMGLQLVEKYHIQNKTTCSICHR
jgi:hypothetical protein